MAWMQVETTRAQIEIHTRRAKLNIQNSLPRIHIRRRNAQMLVERSSPTVSVEYQRVQEPMRGSPVISDVNNIDRLDDGNVTFVHGGSAGMKQRAPSVMRSIKRANTAAATSSRGAVSSTIRHKVHWDPGSIKIGWTPHELEIMWEGNSAPLITVDPYEIEIRLRNYPAVRIRMTEEYYAQLMGHHVDEQA